MSFQVKLNSIDVTSKVIEGPVIHKNDVLHKKIAPNECSFTLNNTDLAYTVSNLNIEGQLVEVWLEGTKQFTGYAEKPNLNLRGKYVTIKAYDKLKQFKGKKCPYVVFINQKTDDILIWLLENVGGLSATDYNLESIREPDSAGGWRQCETGYYSYSPDDNLLSALQEFVDCTGGAMFIDESGILQFTSGFSSTWSSSTVGTITRSKLSDIEGLKFLPSEGDRVIVESDNRSAKKEKEMVFTWSGEVPVEGKPDFKDENGNAFPEKKWKAQFDNPVVEPDDYATANANFVADTALTLNQTVYESNFDASGNFKYTDFMYLQIDNSDTVAHDVDKLVINAKQIFKNPLSVTYDAGSWNTERKVTNNLISSMVWAQSLAIWLYSVGNDKFEIRLPIADFNMVLSWQIGDKIDIIESDTGLSHRAVVREIDLDYPSRKATVTLRSDLDSAFTYTPPSEGNVGSGSESTTPKADGHAPNAPQWADTDPLETFMDKDHPFVRANWKPNSESDVTGYEIYYSYDGTTWHEYGWTPNTSIVLRAIRTADGTDIYVKIRAVDMEQYVSSWSSTQSITVVEDTTPPPVPGSITVDAGYQQIKVDWDSVSAEDLDYYELQRSTDDVTYTTVAKVKGSFFIDTDVSASESYWYRVRTVDNYNNSSNWLKTSSAVSPRESLGDGETPATPTGLTLSTKFENHASYITATWDANTEADIQGYEIQWSYDNTNWNNLGIVVDTTITFQVNHDTTIYVRLRATDIEDKQSSWATANKVSATDTTPPNVPSSITVTKGLGYLKIRWASVHSWDFSHYVLQRSDDEVNYLTIAELDGNSYVDSDVSASETYWYRVQTVDKFNNSSDWRTSTEGVSPSKTPDAPTGLSLDSYFELFQSYVTATWNANTTDNVQGYEVRWSYDNSTWKNLGIVNDTEITFQVKESETVYVNVRTIDVEGYKSSWVSDSILSAATDTTPPSTPSSLSILQGVGLLSISWTGVTDPDLKHYVVERSGNGTDYSAIATTSSTVYIDKDVTYGNTYYYRVKALDVYDNASGYSNVVSATCIKATTGDIAAESITANHLTAALDLSVGRTITIGSVVEMGAGILSGNFDGLYLSPQALLNIGATAYGDPGLFIGNVRYPKITPDMSSNSQDGYVITSFGVTDPYLAFDGDINTTVTFNVGSRVEVELPSAECVTHIRFYCPDTEDISYQLSGSNNNINWDTLLDANFSGTGWTDYIPVTNPDSYLYYKFRIYSSSTGSVNIGEIELTTIVAIANSMQMSLVSSDESYWLKWSGDTLDLKTQNFYLTSNNLIITSGTSPYIGLGVTAYNANNGIWLGKDTDWKMSIKNTDGSNYFRWTGTILEQKGNFILGSGDNSIVFEDSQMKIEDVGSDTFEGESVYRNRTYFTQSNSYFEDLIFSDGYNLSSSELTSLRWVLAERSGTRETNKPWAAKILQYAHVDDTSDCETGIRTSLYYGTDDYISHRMLIQPRSLASNIGAKVTLDGLLNVGGPMKVGFDTGDRGDYLGGTLMWKNSKLYIYDGTDWHLITIGSAEDPWA